LRAARRRRPDHYGACGASCGCSAARSTRTLDITTNDITMVADNQDDADALYRAIGFIVVQWGQAEQTLDMIVAMLYRELGGKRLAKRLPKMLETKLSFSEACFSEISSLATFRSEADILIAEFRRLSQTRHDLIHGAVTSLTPKDNAFLFAKLDIEDDLHHVRDVQLRAAHFPKLADDLVKLGRSAMSLAQKLLKALPSYEGGE